MIFKSLLKIEYYINEIKYIIFIITQKFNNYVF